MWRVTVVAKALEKWQYQRQAFAGPVHQVWVMSERNLTHGSRSTESSSERATLVFKDEHRQLVKANEVDIRLNIGMLYHIEGGRVKFVFFGRDHMPKDVFEEICEQRSHFVYFDPDKMLVGLIFSGVETSIVDRSLGVLTGLIESLLGEPSGSMEHQQTLSGSALIIFRLGINTCLRLLHACCIQRVELATALRNALPGLTKAELRLGTFSPVDVLKESERELSSMSKAEGNEWMLYQRKFKSLTIYVSDSCQLN